MYWYINRDRKFHLFAVAENCEVLVLSLNYE